MSRRIEVQNKLIGNLAQEKKYVSKKIRKARNKSYADDLELRIDEKKEEVLTRKEDIKHLTTHIGKLEFQMNKVGRGSKNENKRDAKRVESEFKMKVINNQSID